MQQQQSKFSAAATGLAAAVGAALCFVVGGWSFRYGGSELIVLGWGAALILFLYSIYYLGMEFGWWQPDYDIDQEVTAAPALQESAQQQQQPAQSQFEEIEVVGIAPHMVTMPVLVGQPHPQQQQQPLPIHTKLTEEWVKIALGMRQMITAIAEMGQTATTESYWTGKRWTVAEYRKYITWMEQAGIVTPTSQGARRQVLVTDVDNAFEIMSHALHFDLLKSLEYSTIITAQGQQIEVFPE